MAELIVWFLVGELVAMRAHIDQSLACSLDAHSRVVIRGAGTYFLGQSRDFWYYAMLFYFVPLFWPIFLPIVIIRYLNRNQTIKK